MDAEVRVWQHLQVFNPFTCSDCPEHSDEHEEYVAGDEGLLWQGLSDDHTAAWNFLGLVAKGTVAQNENLF